MKQTANITFRNVPIEVKEQKSKIIISFLIPDEEEVSAKISI